MGVRFLMSEVALYFRRARPVSVLTMCVRVRDALPPAEKKLLGLLCTCNAGVPRAYETAPPLGNYSRAMPRALWWS